MRLAVIGSGPAGLATAWEAVRSGASVTVYEASPRVGGRMHTDELDGFRIDASVQLLSSTYRTIWRLAQESGAVDRLVRTPGRDALWRRGRAHVLQYGSVASLVTSTALPAALKLRMGVKYLPYLGGAARGLDANDPARTGGAALDGESVADWGARELGGDFVELLAYPLLGAYYGAEPEDVSAAFFHALAKVGTSVEVYAVSGGVGGLAADVAAGLVGRGATLATGQRVQSLGIGDDHVTVHHATGSDSFDACAVAVPADAARDLIASSTYEDSGDDAGSPADRDRTVAGKGARDLSDVLEWLAGVHLAPALTIAFLIEGRVSADYFGLTFPRDTRIGEDIVAICVQSQKSVGLVPRGSELLTAFASPSRVRALIGESSERIVGSLIGAVDAAFPGVRDRIRHARVYRDPAGYPIFYPGYLRHIAAWDPSRLPRTLALAGDYLVAPTVEGAALSGVRAAQRLLSGVSRASRS